MCLLVVLIFDTKHLMIVFISIAFNQLIQNLIFFIYYQLPSNVDSSRALNGGLMLDVYV